jgi:uncharacterized protein (DUF2164 family)
MKRLSKVKFLAAILSAILLAIAVIPAKTAIPAYADAPGTYNTGDIAVINAIIANNNLGWATAAVDGSESPADWTGVTWSSDSTDKRITQLTISSKSLNGNLNVSGLTALEKLYCSGNSLTGLNISGNAALTYLTCGSNQLDTLNLSGNPALTTLQCYDNKLTGLNLSANTELVTLWCYLNQLTTLDTTACTKLDTIRCYQNQLSSLTVARNSTLTAVQCFQNKLAVLNLSGTGVYSWNGGDQAPELTMKWNSATEAFESTVSLTNPKQLVSGLTVLSGGKIRSTDRSINSTAFRTDVGQSGYYLAGTMTLVYPDDVTAPILSNESATDITDKDAKINFTSNEKGLYFYLVLPSSSPEPDKATIKAQGTAVSKGKGDAVASANQGSASGLSYSTDYVAYVFVEDEAGNKSDVSVIPFKTAADTRAPILSNETAIYTTNNGTILQFTSDEAGKYYFLVYEASKGEPDADTIKAQGTAVAKGSGNALDEDNYAAVSDLNASTQYKAYVIVEDASGNKSAVSTIPFTTEAPPDTTAPVLSQEKATDVTQTKATLNFTSNEAGKYYYLLLLATDTAPDAATIKAQGTAIAKGSAAAINGANTVTLSDLNDSTAYKAYVIVVDAAGNKSAVSEIPFTTLVPPDTTAPIVTKQSATGITWEKATLNFTSNEAGTYYYVVYPADASAPDADEIKDEVLSVRAPSILKGDAMAVAKDTGNALAGANVSGASGLSPLTKYVAYLIVEDAAGNKSAVREIAFTTLAKPDTQAPILSNESATDISETEAKLNFTSSEAGTYYYLIFDADMPAPDALKVKAQGTAIAKGTGDALANANTAALKGLTAGTSYKAYVIVEDASGNMSAVSTISFTTVAKADDNKNSDDNNNTNDNNTDSKTNSNTKKTSKTGTVKTGDNAMPILWISIAAISVLMIVIALKRRRKHN